LFNNPKETKPIIKIENHLIVHINLKTIMLIKRIRNNIVMKKEDFVEKGLEFLHTSSMHYRTGLENMYDLMNARGRTNELDDESAQEYFEYAKIIAESAIAEEKDRKNKERIPTRTLVDDLFDDGDPSQFGEFD
jgi:hypothetical protein